MSHALNSWPRIDPAFVDPVRVPAAHADDAPVFDCDVQSVTVGVKYGGRLHPAVHLVFGDSLFEELVHPYGPLFARPERRAFAPGISYAVGHGFPHRVGLRPSREYYIDTLIRATVNAHQLYELTTPHACDSPPRWVGSWRSRYGAGLANPMCNFLIGADHSTARD
jgi:hypothetical protein